MKVITILSLLMLTACDQTTLSYMFDRMDGGCRMGCGGGAPVYLPPPPMGYHDSGGASTTFYYVPGGPVVPVLRIGQ